MYRSAVIHRRYVPAGCVDCLGCLGLSERPFLAFSAELFNRETAIELFYSEQCVHTIAQCMHSRETRDRSGRLPRDRSGSGSHCISCTVVISN